MTVTLEFDLCEYEEKKDLLRALKAPNLVTSLDEFSEYLRQKIKHGEHHHEVYEEVREKLYEILSDNEINLMELA